MNNKQLLKMGVEKEILKNFISNKKEVFKDSLVEYKVDEPCDIKYDNIDYQITFGDSKIKAEKIKALERKNFYIGIRDTLKIAEIIIYTALHKKSLMSGRDIILLIKLENYSTGYNTWKEIYAVFPEKNIQL